ncbi:MAG: glucose/arabinose dehydrogenase/mono/diheme cytochrome c family protein [Glaciecola sp.]
MKNNKKQMLFIAVAQLLVVSLAVIVSYYFTREYRIIPRAIIRLPEVYVGYSDLISIVKVFAVTFLLQILILQFYKRDHALNSKRRFAGEYVAYLFAYTSASLYLFLATTINYDAQLIAGFGIFSTIFYIIFITLFMKLFRSENSEGNIIIILVKRMISFTGLLAVIYFSVPLIMGKAFTSDRDIANKITQVRIWFNPVESSDWGLKNKLPGLTFAQPVLVKQAPNEDSTLYVLERGGIIKKISLVEELQSEVVIDVSDKMGDVEIENGALGFAFNPGFENKPYLYLYYTDTRPQGFQYNRLSRFDMSKSSLEEVNDSETILLELQRSDSGFHNGGSVEFGPDGYFYIGLGEGVHTEVETSDQVLRSGILRLDVNIEAQNSIQPEPFSYGLAQNYRIPNDNPFISNSKIRNEYWALGLRNPFRFTFDSKTGDLWLGDIGSTIWEEVNRIEKGMHYQFPFIEGNQESGVNSWESLDIPQQGPIYTYEHNAYDRAVIGGVVNRSDLYKGLEGKYIFADNYSAKIFVMDADKEKIESVKLIARANQYAQRGISSVVQLKNGEILVTTLGASSEPSGEVLLLVAAEQADVVEPEVNTSDVPEEYDEAATASLFAVNCGRCHGVNGDGKGPDSALLGVEMPDLTSPLYHHSRSGDDIKKIIEIGGAGVGKSPLMPPWKGFLKPEEIEHLVIYIQSLPEKHHKH